jgi:hypothetical protein
MLQQAQDLKLHGERIVPRVYREIENAKLQVHMIVMEKMDANISKLMQVRLDGLKRKTAKTNTKLKSLLHRRGMSCHSVYLVRRCFFVLVFLC